MILRKYSSKILEIKIANILYKKKSSIYHRTSLISLQDLPLMVLTLCNVDTFNVDEFKHCM